MSLPPLLQDTWSYYRRNKLGPITLFQVGQGGGGPRWWAKVGQGSGPCAAMPGQPRRSSCANKPRAARFVPGPAMANWHALGPMAWHPLGSRLGLAANPALPTVPFPKIFFFPTSFPVSLQILRTVHSDEEKYKAVVTHLIDVGLLPGECPTLHCTHTPTSQLKVWWLVPARID